MTKLHLQCISWWILVNTILYPKETGSTSRMTYTFEPDKKSLRYSRMLIDGETLVVGARNTIYQLHMKNLTTRAHLTWKSDNMKTEICKAMGGTEITCQNHIRVLLKETQTRLIACGTNANEPVCRTLKLNTFSQVGNERSGVGLCPKSPEQNNTAVYSGNSIYSGLAIRQNVFLVYKQVGGLGTDSSNNHVLNRPDFVASFEEGDKVYFVFREVAVEDRNCGKRIYSRISRLCKTDTGGTLTNDKIFMSFFKARMECYIPGEFPFHFNEIHSMSKIALGNVNASVSANKMFYAVFTTPSNGIRGSAVCAYKWERVLGVFNGKFKDQKDVNSIWLNVSARLVPTPHPTKCVSNTKGVPFLSQQFHKQHPIMSEAVPPYAGRPILVDASQIRSFTRIVVDFQVEAADKKLYDVLFIGMSDGTVRKAYNRGRKNRIDTVIVEDIPVFSDGLPVQDMKIYKKNSHVSIIVVSENQIKKFSAYDCSAHSSCTTCVGSKDVYCSWNQVQKKCERSTTGLQNLVTGRHQQCRSDNTATNSNTVEITAAAIETMATSFPATGNTLSITTVTLEMTSVKLIGTKSGSTSFSNGGRSSPTAPGPMTSMEVVGSKRLPTTSSATGGPMPITTMAMTSLKKIGTESRSTSSSDNGPVITTTEDIPNSNTLEMALVDGKTYEIIKHCFQLSPVKLQIEFTKTEHFRGTFVDNCSVSPIGVNGTSTSIFRNRCLGRRGNIENQTLEELQVPGGELLRGFIVQSNEGGTFAVHSSPFSCLDIYKHRNVKIRCDVGFCDEKNIKYCIAENQCTLSGTPPGGRRTVTLNLKTVLPEDVDSTGGRVQSSLSSAFLICLLIGINIAELTSRCHA